MSIRGKLLSLILGISFVPVFVIGYVNFSNFKLVSERQLFNTLEIFAQYKHEKIRLYLAGLETRVEDFASDGFVRDSLERFQHVTNRETIVATVRDHLLANKQGLDRRILVIDLMDPSGEVVVSTAPDRVGRGRHDLSHWRDGRGRFISDVTPVAGPDSLAIDVVSVVNSRTDTASEVGYMAVRFDVGMLDRLMTSQWLAPLLRGEQGGGVGISDETYLVNSEGLMINHSRFWDRETLSIQVDSAPVRRCLAHGENMSGQWRNYRGLEVVGAARCIDMGGFRWVLLSEISETEAFALLDEYRRFLSLVLVTVLVLIGVIAVYVTRAVSQPISALNDGVKKIARGDLNLRVGTDKADEIGELSRAFDRMVAAFRESKDEIEGINDTLRHANDELNFMRQAMDQHAIILETDIGGNVIRVNQKFCDVSQYSMQELIGRPLKIINSGHHPKAFFGALWSTISRGRVWHGDICNRRKDGTLYWVRTTIVPHLNVNGKVDRYISLRTDITHQKRVEVNLLRSNRALLASTQIQKVFMDTQDEQTLLDQVCHLLIDEGGYRYTWIGYTQQGEDKRILPVAQAGHSDGYLDDIKVTWGEDEFGQGPVGSAIRSGHEIVIRDTETDARFAPWQRPALERGYLSVIALPLHHGAEVLGVLAIYAGEQDAFDADEVALLKLLADDIAYGLVSLRIRRDRDLAEAALRESEINLKRAQQIARLGSWEWDPGNDVVSWSDELFRILGYEPGSVSPSLPGLLDAVVPEQRHRVEQALRESVRHGQGNSLAFDIIRRDGELRHGVAQWEVYRHADGLVSRVVATLMDVSEQKRAQDERQSLQNQLQHAQKLHAIGQLTSGVAHDFNNILSSIMGYTTLAIEECPVQDAEYLGYLEEVSKAGVRAKQLIAQLMSFSRRESNEAEVIAPASLIQDVFRMVRSALPAAIEFTLSVEPDLAPVYANPIQFQQIATNLVINARDAIDGYGKVSLRARRSSVRQGLCTSCQQTFSGDYIEICVTDTGAGIAPEHLITMFEPFFTTKDVGKGTGMGLAMVHGLAHSFKAHIRVESAVDQGSRFSVYFPVCRDSVGGAEKGKVAAAVPPSASVKSGASILLVDDEAAITRMLANLLRRRGYRCAEAGSAVAALEMFQTKPAEYDLLISDQMMPGMTGMILIGRLRELRADLPVILCSGYSGELSEQDIRTAGISAVLEKPIDLQRLVRAVETALGHTRSA